MSKEKYDIKPSSQSSLFVTCVESLVIMKLYECKRIYRYVGHHQMRDPSKSIDKDWKS